MNPLDRLSALFEKFPGIGPRQAGRFVQHVVRASPSVRNEFISALQEIDTQVRQCPSCMRIHSGSRDLCNICDNARRDTSTLAVVAIDADILALERSGTYKGLYFVLGGTIALTSEKMNGLHMRQLFDSIPTRVEKGLREIILAFPANPEGDATAVRIKEELTPVVGENCRITTLGRGLSTGSELEYADVDTLRNALVNRK
ncbi:MAG: recR [Candidatus Kaiserbacteria bacterium]|nr:recR [Candidatus Kaiserbacteria bacterium]